MRHQLTGRHSPTKRVAPLAAVCLAIAFTLMLSAAAAQRVQFGAKAGPSFSSIVLPYDTGQEFHQRIAATVAAFFVLPLNPRFGVQFEVAASPKGTRLEDGSGVSQTLLLQYLEAPVLLRVAGPRVAGAPLYFVGGPFFGFRISAKEQVSQLAGTYITGVKDDVHDSVK